MNLSNDIQGNRLKTIIIGIVLYCSIAASSLTTTGSQYNDLLSYLSHVSSTRDKDPRILYWWPLIKFEKYV